MLYLAVEGIEGAGKSTLLHKLRASNPGCVFVREPGGTIAAERIRDVIKGDHCGERLVSSSELLLFTAARVQLLSEVVRPALQAGKVVLSDRSFYSTIAYQGAGNGDIDSVKLLIDTFIRPIAAPNVVVYLDIDYATSQSRIQARGELDHIEQRGEDYFNRVRDRYLAMAAADSNVWTIDASQSPEDIFNDVQRRLKETL